MTNTEELKRLDRIIELLEIMTNDESKAIKNELKQLHDWKTTSEAVVKSKSTIVEMLRWFGPWLVAIVYVLFEHKIG